MEDGINRRKGGFFSLFDFKLQMELCNSLLIVFLCFYSLSILFAAENYDFELMVGNNIRLVSY